MWYVYERAFSHKVAFGFASPTIPRYWSTDGSRPRLSIATRPFATAPVWIYRTFLVCLGVLLLDGGGAYYGFVAKARADLAALNASLHPAAITSVTSNSWSRPPLSDQDGPGASGGGGVI